MKRNIYGLLAMIVLLTAAGSRVQAAELTQNALLVGSAATAWEGRSVDHYARAKVTAYSLEDYTELLSFEAYPKKIGVQIAVGDVDGDGEMEMITLPLKDRLSPTVKVFNLAGELEAADVVPKYEGDRLKQYHLAVGDVDGDDQDDIVLSNATGSKLTLDVFMMAEGVLDRTDHYELDQPAAYSRGSWVEVADVDEDDVQEIITTPMIGETILDIFSIADGDLTHELTYEVDNGNHPAKGLHIAAKLGAILADEHVEGNLHLLVWTGSTFEEGPLETLTSDYTIGDIGDLAWLTSGTYAYSMFSTKTVHYHSYSASGNNPTAEEEIDVNSKGGFVEFLDIE